MDAHCGSDQVCLDNLCIAKNIVDGDGEGDGNVDPMILVASGAGGLLILLLAAGAVYRMAKHYHGSKLADDVAQTPSTFTASSIFSSKHSPISQSAASVESKASLQEAGLYENPATFNSSMRTASRNEI